MKFLTLIQFALCGHSTWRVINNKCILYIMLDRNPNIINPELFYNHGHGKEFPLKRSEELFLIKNHNSEYDVFEAEILLKNKKNWKLKIKDPERQAELSIGTPGEIIRFDFSPEVGIKNNDKIPVPLKRTVLENNQPDSTIVSETDDSNLLKKSTEGVSSKKPIPIIRKKIDPAEQIINLKNQSSIPKRSNKKIETKEFLDQEQLSLSRESKANSKSINNESKVNSEPINKESKANGDSQIIEGMMNNGELNSDNDIKIDNEVRKEDYVKSRDELKPDNEVKSKDELNPDNEIKSKDELKPDNEIKSKDELKPDNAVNPDKEIKASGELKSEKEVKTDNEVKIVNKVKMNGDCKIVEDLKVDGDSKIDKKEKINGESKADNEEVNIDNEEVKIDNEEVKIDNEEVKIDNEEVKIDNEEVKIDNEEVKIDNEEVKIDNEEVKIDNEEVKIDNEVKILKDPKTDEEVNIDNKSKMNGDLKIDNNHINEKNIQNNGHSLILPDIILHDIKKIEEDIEADAEEQSLNNSKILNQGEIKKHSSGQVKKSNNGGELINDSKLSANPLIKSEDITNTVEKNGINDTINQEVKKDENTIKNTVLNEGGNLIKNENEIKATNSEMLIKDLSPADDNIKDLDEKSVENKSNVEKISLDDKQKIRIGSEKIQIKVDTRVEDDSKAIGEVEMKDSLGVDKIPVTFDKVSMSENGENDLVSINADNMEIPDSKHVHDVVETNPVELDVSKESEIDKLLERPVIEKDQKENALSSENVNTVTKEDDKLKENNINCNDVTSENVNMKSNGVNKSEFKDDDKEVKTKDDANLTSSSNENSDDEDSDDEDSDSSTNKPGNSVGKRLLISIFCGAVVGLLCVFIGFKFL